MVSQFSIPAGPHDVRLVVCDMDGTLLDEHGRVPDEFWPLLPRLSARGITFVPASGRQYATLARMFASVPGRVAYIAENGTLVVQDGAAVSTTYLDASAVRRAIESAREASATRDLGLVVCGRTSAYIERSDAAFLRETEQYYAELAIVDDLTTVRDDVLKVAIYDFDSADDCAAEVFAELQTTHQVVVSGKHWVDIMDLRANKGRGVRALQERLGITAAQTVVFGDYLNDLEMLDAGELSFAVDNAHPLIRERARYLAPSNAEHGVVTVLEQLLSGSHDD